ncbi:MAG: HPr family phosphocarrier protein [Candidatus Wallbacteria bacterium]|nr:HPr family phosphocarrier protein [Candidatus Wallbacteria bacterium]MBI4866129.1 HPr family phosphocarrier protein [Candidatus Wallbacteria bacterium]
MIQAKGRVTNKLGLHARTAVTIVNALSRFKSEVYFAKDDMRVSAKSILGVMMLEASQGTELVLECEGEDEEDAMKAILDLFENRFGED